MSNSIYESCSNLPGICKKPLFIIGSPRSGTSVLAWSLAQNTCLWTSGEIHILFALFGPEWFDNHFQKERSLPHGWFSEHAVSKDEFLRYIGIGLNALLSSRSEGRRWVEQTPLNTLLLDNLAALFPDALFLHILRDGRSVVNSMINFHNAVEAQDKALLVQNGWFPPWATDFRTACQTWRGSVAAAKSFCSRRPAQALTIKYEDLVSDPAKTFVQIAEFAGVPFESAMVDFLRTRRMHSSYVRASDSPGPSFSPSDVVGSWTREERLIFLGEAGPMMFRCGYLHDVREILPIEVDPYREMIVRIRGKVAPRLAHHAVVGVCSKGDSELLNLFGRRAMHFPLGEDGEYSGHHPADSCEAIKALGMFRARGGTHLLIPQTAFWWLEHYQGLTKHLETACREVLRDEDCLLVEL